MPRPYDPCTLANEAMAGLLQADAFIAALNWRSWENNVEHATLPRGYVNVSCRSALDDADNAERFEFEVVVEAKPQTDLNREMLATILGHCIRPDLKTALTARITDGSLTFLGKPESLQINQRIAGELRVWSVTFVLHGTWNVAWIPDP